MDIEFPKPLLYKLTVHFKGPEFSSDSINLPHQVTSEKHSKPDVGN